MIIKDLLCPGCCGAGGENQNVAISYYDRGLEWVVCKTCEGNGYITLQQYRSYVKQQIKFWSAEASK